MATGFETWLLGYAGGKLADSILSFFKEDGFIKELNTALEDWAKTLPDHAGLYSPKALFPNEGRLIDLNDHPKLRVVRKKIEDSEIPTTEEFNRALLEQFQYIKKTIAQSQQFFTIPENEAEKHLNRLAEKLRKTCENNDDLFKGEVIRLLKNIAGQQSDNHNISATDLSSKQKQLISRLYQHEKSCCRISAPKGEYKCLWVPGALGPMQWGYERTPKEVELSGKDRGDRENRLSWLFVVKDLLQMGFLEDVEGHDGHFQLSEKGLRAGNTLYETDVQ